MAGAEVRADLWINEYISPWDIYQHGITELLWAAKTKFQDAQIVKTGVYGTALVLDGKWQSCSGDEFLYHEPLVQPACVMLAAKQRPPRNILILGGGEGATSRETLRWNSAERVTMVDIDGEVVTACKQFLADMHRGAFDDPRHDLVIGDALEYIKDPANTPDGGWDLIISDLSDPIEDGPSFPLFTKEYFADLKSILAPHGLLVVQAGPVSPPELIRHARLSCTLRSVFNTTSSVVSDVPTYPGPWSFIIAGDEGIEPPSPHRTDELLAANLRSDIPPLRMFDGEALLGLIHLPKHLRRAIETETEVYTMDKPPVFFGSGAVRSVSQDTHTPKA